MRDVELEPATMENDDPIVMSTHGVEREWASARMCDGELLRSHRVRLLAAQALTPGDIDVHKPMQSPRADFVVAAIYTLYVAPMAVWVFGLGTSRWHLFSTVALSTVALILLCVLWRQYARAWRRRRRSRVYVGVLLEKSSRSSDPFTATALFEGGHVELPPHLHEALIPGVRYRLHAPGTDDIAIDVALDDEPPLPRAAYR